MARHKKPLLLAPKKHLQVSNGAPDVPRPLSNGALHEWNRLVPLLLKIKTLTEMDGDALAAYCETIERYRKCKAHLEIEGMTISTSHGTSAHPLLLEMRTCQRFMRDFENDYGMRHLARSKIKAAPAEDHSDPFEAFVDAKP